GLVGRVGDSSRRHSPGTLRAVAGLPLRTARRLCAFSGERAAGGGAEFPGDRSRVAAGAGAARAAGAVTACPGYRQRMPVSGAVRMDAKQRAGVANARLFSARLSRRVT